MLYAMIQRLLAAGAASLGNTRQLIAGEVPGADTTSWRQLAGDEEALSNEFASHAGVYEDSDAEKLLAINRSANEDVAAVVARERVEGLFEGLDVDRVDDTAGSGASLIQEIWRLFLMLMLIALVLEAILCIPKKVVPGSDSLFASPGAAS